MSLLSKIFPDITQSKQFSLDIILSHFLGIDDIKEDQQRKCCLYNSDVMGVISLKFFNFPFLFMISPRYKIFCLIKKFTKCIFCLTLRTRAYVLCPRAGTVKTGSQNMPQTSANLIASDIIRTGMF